ncbi:MAG: pyrroline-5-carboxylate reductase [Oscillospiraceae bacterium]|nr:pyrroline-5-carboxylate reductase [Oscillospiraceae bacterium]
MTVGFIGAGNMAGSMIRGMVNGGFSGEDIIIYDIDAAKTAALAEKCGVRAAASPEALIDMSETVVLAVKPQYFPAVVPPLAAALTAARPLIISIAAGLTIASVEGLLDGTPAIVRTMPNMNAQVGQAVSAFCGNARVTEDDKQTVRTIFGSFGGVYELEERLFSIFSVLAACSPAYTHLYIDAMAQAGVRHGLPKELAAAVAAQSVLGSAKMLLASGEHPRILIDRICSPGGTTIEGIAALQTNGFEAAVMKAVTASYKKDKGMS